MKDDFEDRYKTIVQIKRKLKIGLAPSGESLSEYVVVNNAFKCDIQPGQTKLVTTEQGVTVIASKLLFAPVTQELYEKDVIVETIERIGSDFAIIPAIAPYEVKATKNDYIANKGVWNMTNKNNPVAMELIVDGDLASGQYKVNGSGVYTFSSDDSGLKVMVKYLFRFLDHSLVENVDRLDVIPHIEATITSYGGKV